MRDPLQIIRQTSFVQTNPHPSNMKFLVLALALVGAASAGYLAPPVTGYSGLGWGHGIAAAPAVTGYSGLGWGHGIAAAPAISAYAAPAYAHSAYAAPAYAHAAYPAPAYAHAAYPAPAYAHSAYANYGTVAPFASAYHAGPAFAPAYGVAAPSVYGNTWGGDAYGVDLWKKKKAAAH